MATAAPTPGPNTTTSTTGAGGGVSTVERPQWWISRDSPQTDRVSCSLKNEPETMGNNTASAIAVKITLYGPSRTNGAPMDPLDNPNPSLSYYRRDDPAPVLPLREEPDLLSWLQDTGRLLQEEKYQGQDLSTMEEEELSVLMGERENYSKDDEQEDTWEE